MRGQRQACQVAEHDPQVIHPNVKSEHYGAAHRDRTAADTGTGTGPARASGRRSPPHPQPNLGINVLVEVIRPGVLRLPHPGSHHDANED